MSSCSRGLACTPLGSVGQERKLELVLRFNQIGGQVWVNLLKYRAWAMAMAMAKAKATARAMAMANAKA